MGLIQQVELTDKYILRKKNTENIFQFPFPMLCVLQKVQAVEREEKRKHKQPWHGEATGK